MSAIQTRPYRNPRSGKPNPNWIEIQIAGEWFVFCRQPGSSCETCEGLPAPALYRGEGKKGGKFPDRSRSVLWFCRRHNDFV